MEEVLNNANKVICITTPVGSGKSTFIEAMTCCIQDRDPGPMLLTPQTDQDAQDWAETGLWPKQSCQRSAGSGEKWNASFHAHLST